MMNRSERGTTMILVAGSMMLLLGMAAIALDLGAAWNERRQDQTSSDLSAVAGGLSYGDNAAIVTQVLTNSRANLDSTYTDPEWSSIWLNCTDPDRPAGFTPLISGGNTYNCISLSVSYLRVRLPDQIRGTTFAKAIGVDTITTNADTVVTFLPPGGTGLLPFAVQGNAAAGEICLDTGTGQPDPPCDGNEQGSFGNIAPPLFGNPNLGTTPACSNQTSNNNYVAESIAMGVDHLIWRFSASDWAASGWTPASSPNNNSVDALVNMDECTDTGGFIAQAADGLPIEGVYVDTGNNVTAAVTEGLVSGTNFADGLDARLTRSTNTRMVAGHPLDNTPLWAHLRPAAVHGLAYCDPTEITGAPNLAAKNQLMTDCLVDYETNGATAQIFADTIMDTPRFGAAPVLWHNNLGNGMSFRPVKEFALVYVGGVWFDRPNPNGTIFYPDDTDSSPIPINGNWDVEQVTAYLLLPNMVSDDAKNFYPGFDDESLIVSIYQ